MLPTVMFILYVACRRIQAARAQVGASLPSKRATSPAHAAAMELTAWPGVPIGILQFATFQAGLLLLVGVILTPLHARQPLAHGQRPSVVCSDASGHDRHAARHSPNPQQARFVVLASALLVIVLLGSAAITIAQGPRKWRNLAEMTPFCKRLL